MNEDALGTAAIGAGGAILGAGIVLLTIRILTGRPLLLPLFNRSGGSCIFPLFQQQSTTRVTSITRDANGRLMDIVEKVS